MILEQHIVVQAQVAIMHFCVWFTDTFQSSQCRLKITQLFLSIQWDIKHILMKFSLCSSKSWTDNIVFQGSHHLYILRLSSSFPTGQSISLCESTLRYQRAVAPTRRDWCQKHLQYITLPPISSVGPLRSFLSTEDQSMSISQRLMNVPSVSDWHAYHRPARHHWCAIHVCVHLGRAGCKWRPVKQQCISHGLPDWPRRTAWLSDKKFAVGGHWHPGDVAIIRVVVHVLHWLMHMWLN